MKKLDPKATWLFFFNFLIPSAGIVFGLLFFGSPLLPLVLESINLSAILSSVFFFFVIVLATAFAWAKLTYHFYGFELRGDGFRKEHGVISKKYVTIPYQRIQNVDIHRSLLARILGLSAVKIQTAGGISTGSYGASSEGFLPGVSKEEAEIIRDDLIRRAGESSQSGV